MHASDNGTVTITRRVSSLPKYNPLNPIPRQMFDRKDTVMVAGIVQSDLRMVEISIEKIICGNAHITISDLEMFQQFLMVACRLEDVFEYPYKVDPFPNSPEDEPTQ